MLHAQKMDIRFLLVRPVMIRKKKKLLQRVIPKELEYTGDTYCRICKTLLEEGKILPKLEHQWNDGTVTKRATYETAGELTYRCRKCAAKRIISIEKLAYPKAGTSYTISGNEYKVSKPGAEVILVKTSKTTKNVTVPAQIYAQGITYKVTSIGAKAFNNNKKLTKVTIGTNIVKINSNAFFNCKNLKTVTIKSVHLTGKTANKKAFKNAHKKLVIRVPKKVKRIYKKIFKGLKVK
ncbi:Leucine-rich repeat domain, L domain-like [Anaerobutyricum hallii]|uniref:Leucine-rich repeat domain, L domain-like n=2 Tax=Anaerobutyricum TaxID=2569097 RepID=A0A285PR58_9FIRM|nr:Leucine-rich repeat domain, L domain-like [Anaerobutyricum hallii]